MTGLRVPERLVCRGREAVRRARPIVRALVKGVPPSEAVGEMVPIAQIAGSILLDGPNRLVASTPHVQGWSLMRCATKPYDREARDRLGRVLLGEPWGGLFLLGQDSQGLLETDWFPKELIRWMAANFEALCDIETRFGHPVQPRQTIWDPPSNLYRAAARCGADTDQLLRERREGFAKLAESVLRGGC